MTGQKPWKSHGRTRGKDGDKKKESTDDGLTGQSNARIVGREVT